METFRKAAHHMYYEPSRKEDITIGITTRNDGVSPFPKNAFNMARYIKDEPNHITAHQDTLAHEIGIPKSHWVFPIQTHGHNVIEVSTQDQGTNIDTLSDNELYGIDGMYTFDKDTLLTMCYADCVPIYVYSVKHHFIALLHAGWRGTVQQIVHQLLLKYPYDYKDLKVVIGPATSNSYEINNDIYRQFQELPIDTNQYIEQREENRHGIDLKVANQLLFEHYGVPAQNITMTNYTTSEHLDLFFSYRIEKGQTGRMLAFIGQK
ncbi:polyphenol oxidase family protein [Staphylococcus canis]|uniref:Polyphenol oxidase family protein n=1 Tax=Staphylococcus canis TaxID=2724942 RepID=A0ABS0T711_9STAP|nr:polyphenol oxidase family protein [Staphylococcus canis]MBI5974534.1 polyphenol oxidase family protein [Staphylococcus canis]